MIQDYASLKKFHKLSQVTFTKPEFKQGIINNNTIQ